MYEDPTFHSDEIEVPEKYIKAGNMVSKGTKAKKDAEMISGI